MRIRSAPVLVASFLVGLLASSRTGEAQGTDAGRYQSEPPYIALSLLGSDVVFSPDRVRYSFSADPGSYVTVFLISPSGRRTVLNPYQRAIAGSTRQVFLREATTGFETGESYLVAMATRSAFHSANLVRQTQGAGRFAGANMGAEASLNELLTAIMPIAGADFSATYVSFRVISRGLGRSYAYAARCNGSVLIPGNAFVDDDFYLARSMELARYDVFTDQEPLLYSLNQPYLSACRGSVFDRSMLFARAQAPSMPAIVRRDTGVVAVDTGRTPGKPAVPRTHPVDPDAPGIGSPAIPGPLGAGPAIEIVRPLSIPVRADPLTEPPVTPAMPVTIERREPVAPVIAPPLRVHPVDHVEREMPQPVREPMIPANPPMPTPVVSPPMVSPAPRPSRIVDPAPTTPTPAPPPA